MTILHLKERVEKEDINRITDTKGRNRVRFLDIMGICNTSVNNNGVGREVRVKEPMLAIDKLEPSLIIILVEAV